MPFLVASFACGLIFGAGLMISGMTDPAKVLGFLDIFGAWDATLALVMAGAVAVSGLGFAIARRRGTPVLAERSFWPTRTDIDAQLLIAGGLFGIGWGLVGFCPGPALVNLAGLSLPVVAFVAAMAVGMVGYDAWQQRGISPRIEAEWLHQLDAKFKFTAGEIEKTRELDHSAKANLDRLLAIGLATGDRDLTNADFPPVFDIAAMRN